MDSYVLCAPWTLCNNAIHLPYVFNLPSLRTFLGEGVAQQRALSHAAALSIFDGAIVGVEAHPERAQLALPIPWRA